MSNDKTSSDERAKPGAPTPREVDGAVVAEILSGLGETEHKALAQIVAIIDVLGEKGARACLQDTLATEQRGGLRTTDGRRRTRGGVFFQLVRERLSVEARREIFQRLPRLLKKAEKKTTAR